MTKIRKEWLSALIDGEASEIEVHRLVREFRSDETLNSSWAVYQKIRATARTNTDRLSIEHHQRLFDRISAAVEGEDTHSGSLSASTGFSNTGFSKKVVFGSLALAASLVVAVFIGVSQPGGDTPLAGSSPVVNNAPIATVPVSVSNLPANDRLAESTPELIELDEEKQRRLRAYMNQHDRMARMNPGKQLVNYQETPDK